MYLKSIIIASISSLNIITPLLTYPVRFIPKKELLFYRIVRFWIEIFRPFNYLVSSVTQVDFKRIKISYLFVHRVYKTIRVKVFRFRSYTRVCNFAVSKNCPELQAVSDTNDVFTVSFFKFSYLSRYF